MREADPALAAYKRLVGLTPGDIVRYWFLGRSHVGRVLACGMRDGAPHCLVRRYSRNPEWIPDTWLELERPWPREVPFEA